MDAKPISMQMHFISSAIWTVFALESRRLFKVAFIWLGLTRESRQ